VISLPSVAATAALPAVVSTTQVTYCGSMFFASNQRVNDTFETP